MRHDPRASWFIRPIHQTELSKRDSPWSCEEESLVSPSAVVSFPSEVPERLNLWTSSLPPLSMLEIRKREINFVTSNWICDSRWIFLRSLLLSSDFWDELLLPLKIRFNRSHFKLKLTNNFVDVGILDSHLDFPYAEIHFAVFNAEERSVIIFLLVWNSFEVNFALDSFVFAPVISLTGSFDQNAEMLYV